MFCTYINFFRIQPQFIKFRTPHLHSGEKLLASNHAPPPSLLYRLLRCHRLLLIFVLNAYPKCAYFTDFSSLLCIFFDFDDFLQSRCKSIVLAAASSTKMCLLNQDVCQALFPLLTYIQRYLTQLYVFFKFICYISIFLFCL